MSPLCFLRPIRHLRALEPYRGVKEDQRRNPEAATLARVSVREKWWLTTLKFESEQDGNVGSDSWMATII
jgi:hypothetical protein